MKTKFLFLTICAMLLVPLSAEAQVTNFLKKKTKKAAKTATKTADKEVDREIDKNVTKGVLNLKNKLLESAADSSNATVKDGRQQDAETATGGGNNSSSTDGSSRGAAPGLGALSAIMGDGADVPHKKSYDFNSSIDIEMLSYENGGDAVATVISYTTYLNDKSLDVAIDIKPQSEDPVYKGDMTMIYDKDNNVAFTLTSQDGQKIAIATPMDELESMPGDEEGEECPDEGDEPGFTKTGRTKTIHGYKCDEYIMVDEDTRAEIWFTHDTYFISGREQMKVAGIPVYEEGPFEGAMMMEMDVFEYDEKTMSMYVRGVNKNISKSFTLDTY
ncbi:MAG: DUF4412 domain-containing protein, partial [Bacteroidales bacterium]